MKTIDYLKQLPIPTDIIPSTLKALLKIETTESPSKQIQVTTNFEKKPYTDGHETLQMIMACVPEGKLNTLGQLRESSEGVVSYSTPICDELGGLRGLTPSISGFEYIVASWGDGARYSYSLSEKVWMTLGLSPRVAGNSIQKVTYDDLSKPVICVASGDFASEYFFHSSRSINWCMRNDYLRKYLWMNGYWGVRVFYYEALIDDCESIRKLMGQNNYYQCNKPGSWYDLVLRQDNNKILLQLHATVPSIAPEKCYEVDKNSLIWPGDTTPMNKARTNTYINDEYVFINDTFLEKYEKDSMFECIPFEMHNQFYCCPSYGGQWAFNDCIRVGRNLLKISIYELYKGVPTQEILHAHKHAISDADANVLLKQDKEHIVSKVFLIVEELVCLAENLSSLIRVTDNEDISASEFIVFNRQELDAEGIRNYPIIQKMAQVSPWGMSEQDFLSRSKTLNEIIGRFKPVPIRKVLLAMGADVKATNSIKGLRLLQALFNILDLHNEQSESNEILNIAAKDVNITARNDQMAPLFINNDLRNNEAHESFGKSLELLEGLGFDTSFISEGYGSALDFLLDGVLNTFCELNSAIKSAIQR